MPPGLPETAGIMISGLGPLPKIINKQNTYSVGYHRIPTHHFDGGVLNFILYFILPDNP